MSDRILAWCDVFVDWCFLKTFGYDMAIKLLCTKERSSGAGCIESARYYRNKKQFYRDPKVGDQIFFGGSNGYETHTGIVVAVSGTRVTTIEGNTNAGSAVIPNGGGVYEKSYPLDHYYIVGYGRPDYTLVTEVLVNNDKPLVEEPEKPAVSKETAAKGAEETVEVAMKTLKKGSKGAQVKTLQCLLIMKFDISCGNSGADGDFGANTDKAVRAFQKKKALAVDGICGKATWTALLAG